MPRNYHAEYERRKKKKADLDASIKTELSEEGVKVVDAKPLKKGAPKNAQIDVNLVKELLPALFVGLCINVLTLIVDEAYRECLPTEGEMSAILKPLFNMLSRSIEIVGSVTESTMDLINAGIAVVMFGMRASSTYLKIKESKSNDPQETRASFEPSYSQQGTTFGDDTYTQNGHDKDPRGEANLIAGLFARDRQYRTEHGLN